MFIVLNMAGEIKEEEEEFIPTKEEEEQTDRNVGEKSPPKKRSYKRQTSMQRIHCKRVEKEFNSDIWKTFESKADVMTYLNKLYELGQIHVKPNIGGLNNALAKRTKSSMQHYFKFDGENLEICEKPKYGYRRKRRKNNPPSDSDSPPSSFIEAPTISYKNLTTNKYPACSGTLFTKIPEKKIRVKREETHHVKELERLITNLRNERDQYAAENIQIHKKVAEQSEQIASLNTMIVDLVKKQMYRDN